MLAIVFLGWISHPALTAYAQVPTSFHYERVGGEAVIMGYADDAFDGNMVVPAYLTDGSIQLPITTISRAEQSVDGFEKFNANNSITSLDLTNATNLKYITERAFYKSGLTGELYLPSSLLSISSRAFSNTNINKVFINRAEIEDGAFVSGGYTEIASDAFSDMTTITFVFPNQEILDLYANTTAFAGVDCDMIVQDTTPPDEGEDDDIVESVTQIEVVFDLDFDAAISYDNLQRALNKTFNTTKNDSEEWSENPQYTFPTPERVGCEFLGWALTPNGESFVNETDTITEDVIEENKVVLYAVWQEKYYNITYHYSNDFTPVSTLPANFGYLTGANLPDLESNNLFIEWTGWYIDDDEESTSSIPAGIAKNIDVWAKYKSYAPNVEITGKMASGEEIDTVYFNDEVIYTASVSNYPVGCEISYRWEINDTTWVNIGTSTQCVIGSKMPKQYSVRCAVTLSKNGKTETVYGYVVHDVEKWDITIDWKSTPQLTYTGAEYVHDFDISYSNEYINNSCIIKTYVKEDDEYVLCDEVINAGDYKIVVEIKEAYKGVAKITNNDSLEFTINKSEITTSYKGEMHTKEYDGSVYTPEILLYDTNWEELGCDLNMISQSVYYKKANTYHLLAKYALSENVKLDTIANCGQYCFELSVENENYILKSLYKKQFVNITPKKVNIVWTNVNLEYTGASQIPTAYAEDVNGDELQLEVSGAKIDANPYVSNLYVATAETLDDNYELNNPTCEFYISKASTYIDYEVENNSVIKMYDGKKYKISASVYSARGKVADNVVIACSTDLTSMGKHKVVLTWAGDKNHFASNNVVLNISIKTENIVVENENNKVVISSQDGFDSHDEVLVQNNDNTIVSKSIYNSLNSAYNVHDIYKITNTKSKDLTINLALPEGVKSSKDVKVFEILASGEMKEVEYLIENASIKITSSSAESTFAVVCVKNTASVGIILGCVFGGVGLGVVVMLVVIKKRKKSISL